VVAGSTESPKKANGVLMAQPTETTPLILGRTEDPSPTSPPLAPVVNLVRLHGLQLLDDPTLFSSRPASLSAQVSFKMIVLLQLYLQAKVPRPTEGRDIWEQWSKDRTSSLDAEDLERRCMIVWEEFLEVSRSTQEIEDCLWAGYPLEEGGSPSVRGMLLNGLCWKVALTLFVTVIDVLKDTDAPSNILSHKLVTLSLLHTWTHGKTIAPAGSLSRRILQRFASVATPR
jgi:hypothetical protein